MLFICPSVKDRCVAICLYHKDRTRAVARRRDVMFRPQSGRRHGRRAVECQRRWPGIRGGGLLAVRRKAGLQPGLLTLRHEFTVTHRSNAQDVERLSVDRLQSLSRFAAAGRPSASVYERTCPALVRSAALTCLAHRNRRGQLLGGRGEVVQRRLAQLCGDRP